MELLNQLEKDLIRVKGKCPCGPVYRHSKARAKSSFRTLVEGLIGYELRQPSAPVLLQVKNIWTSFQDLFRIKQVSLSARLQFRFHQYQIFNFSLFNSAFTSAFTSRLEPPKSRAPNPLKRMAQTPDHQLSLPCIHFPIGHAHCSQLQIMERNRPH